MLTLGLSTTLKQFFRPKYYTTTILRLKVSISKGLSYYMSIGKTMTRNQRFRPANFWQVSPETLFYKSMLLNSIFFIYLILQ